MIPAPIHTPEDASPPPYPGLSGPSSRGGSVSRAPSYRSQTSISLSRSPTPPRHHSAPIPVPGSSASVHARRVSTAPDAEANEALAWAKTIRWAFGPNSPPRYGQPGGHMSTPGAGSPPTFPLSPRSSRHSHDGHEGSYTRERERSRWSGDLSGILSRHASRASQNSQTSQTSNLSTLSENTPRTVTVTPRTHTKTHCNCGTQTCTGTARTGSPSRPLCACGETRCPGGVLASGRPL
ncbi:uncharacterized protein EHS24_000032 [Apiotrichum porosum]|uniref:Uncharacterized protein n=1 Tax=Apiotrichum porosum TaxID=105984 RepID=A0A427Y946_9TREE|nr:uncharacterized protein EHS24_000032 [Apiotrichum porosum]RSH87524.1 hypothetical protein EHS24_000032 [Apiotrichum porosum]